MNRKVDLHLHTIASDGSWTPREAVLAAKKAGLGIMAVTDHDSLGSVAPVMKLAPKEGIEVIAGVEMCSTYEGRCFHILGYGFDCSNPILLAHLAITAVFWKKRMKGPLESYLKKAGPFPSRSIGPMSMIRAAAVSRPSFISSIRGYAGCKGLFQPHLH